MSAKINILTIVLIFSLSANIVYSVDFEEETENRAGNYDLQTNNLGMVFKSASFLSSVYWPKDSDNGYIYGTGYWFGAQKWNDQDQEMKKLCFLTYDPRNGMSWAIPGYYSYDATDTIGPDFDTDLYGIYSSMDYNENGTPAGDEKYNWPWLAPYPTPEYNMGDYIANPDNRQNNSSRRALVVSDEDISTVFKDSDLSRYYNDGENLEAKGYPLGIQFEQRILNWDNGYMKDCIIIMISYKNISADTLYNCFMSPVFDFDIGGPANDRLRYYDSDPSIETVASWSNSDMGDAGKGFGYMGISQLLSPKVIKVYDGSVEIETDSTDFIRQDVLPYSPKNNIGLGAVRNWSIAEDFNDDMSRYNFISSGLADGDNGPGDKRTILSTGPFHMRPGDEAVCAYMVSFALPSNGEEADGSDADMNGLIDLIKKARLFFYQDVLTSVENEGKAPEGKGLVLYDPSPNPADIQSEFYFRVYDSGSVDFSVWDLNGNRVMDIGSAVYGEGVASKVVNTSTLAPGTYFIMGKTKNDISTLKLTVVR